MTREELIRELGIDRPMAHKVLFAHRRPETSPPFHDMMIEDWHGPHAQVLTEAFRGAAKSTIAEEALIIRGAYREFSNALIIGETLERACERLSAIRHEIDTNERLYELFGDLRGSVWAEDEIVLSSGIRILAMGRGQAIRGIKHNDKRPDAVFCDDLENLESVRTPEMRQKTKRWFISELIPACDPKRFIRMAATPVDPECLCESLRKDPTWKALIIPIEHPDENGVMVSSWEERFPVEWIEEKKRSYELLGMMREYSAEFLCEAMHREDRPFRQEMFRVEPQVRTWQAVYGMFDPARTVNARSATTGFASWSWIGALLVVWDAWAKMLMPDEIVDSVFRFAEAEKPTWIGVEEDGLNEFLMQPIRQRQAKLGESIPVRPVKAPRGKIEFIRGLQPFFSAREIWFAKPLPELQNQFLSFPTGRIDAPNALAYALKMRPGAPMYDDFGNRHVGEDLSPTSAGPVWLCLNAGRGFVTGVLVQSFNGTIRIYGDMVREGEAGSALAALVQDAQLECGRSVRLVCGPSHRDKYNNFGLIQAAKKIPMEVRVGTEPDVGRGYLRPMFQREKAGLPVVMISDRARWTLNALAGGYSRVLLKQGVLADYAEEGVYRTLMEGLESFLGLNALGSPDDGEADLNYAYAGGRRYVSALPRR